MIPDINPVEKNMTILTIGAVSLYYSYNACIAFNASRIGGKALFNPHYRKFSTTTSKHATAMHVSNFPDAASREEFANELALQLRETFLSLA